MFKLLSLLTCLVSVSSFAQTMTSDNVKQGTQAKDPSKYPLKELVLDQIIYEDNVYSNSKKTELGDNVELGMAFRYQVNKDSFGRFRFETSPRENRTSNKTSKFELIYASKFENFKFQLDLELKTDDGDNGGNTVGLDLDSDDTYLGYAFSENFSGTFYPFNFRADVGNEFRTGDVNEINYIEGSPSSFDFSSKNGGKIVTKTIPGVEFKYELGEASYAYAGLGIATYLYPADAAYDIESNQSATYWERKEVAAYKAGYLYNVDGDSRLSVQYVKQNDTEETGALLESAASLNYFKKVSKFVVEAEATITKAGKAPWNIDSAGTWFKDNGSGSGFRPVYTSENDVKHEWIGETDSAYALKIGYKMEKMTPYLSLKYQGENFVYDSDNSAHKLRTALDDKSHGGLTRVGLGSYFYYNNLYFNPFLEWQQAKNPVFTTSTSLASDRKLSSFKKENISLQMKVVWTFDGNNLNQNWWF